MCISNDSRFNFTPGTSLKPMHRLTLAFVLVLSKFINMITHDQIV